MVTATAVLAGCSTDEPTAATDPIPISEFAEGYYKVARNTLMLDCEQKPAFRKVLSVFLGDRGRVRWQINWREDVFRHLVEGWTQPTGCLELELADTPYDEFERPHLNLCPRDGGFVDDQLRLAQSQCPYSVRLDYYGTIDPWPMQGDRQDGGNPQF